MNLRDRYRQDYDDPHTPSCGSAEFCEAELFGSLPVQIQTRKRMMPCFPIPTAAVWRIDLHVHTKRYSPCAESLDPAHVAQSALQKKLNGIVFAEHDRIWRHRELKELNRLLKGIRIFRGMEVSAREGHFVVIGIDRNNEIRPGIKVADLVRIVHRQRAAVILVHPFLSYPNTPRPMSISDMPLGIDAVEICSCVTSDDDTACAITEAEHRGWAMVGGSDAHCLDQIGQACTGFDRWPENEKELAQLIRSGRTEPIWL